MDVTARSRTGSRLGSTLAFVMTCIAGMAPFTLGSSGCSGGSGSNPVLTIETATATSTPTPTPTPTPTATATPIPISATQAGTGAALVDFKAAGAAWWNGNQAWLMQLLGQFEATPELLQGFKTSTAAALASKWLDDAVLDIAGADFLSSPDDSGLPPAYSPRIRSEVSVLALDLHNFETDAVYGDTKDELPRANCDFTANPKGVCTPATDLLTIRFNNPTFGDNLVTFFDWTGASTGKSSPTVLAHDPLNPGTIIELPTRMVWELRSKSTTLLSAVIDIQWASSPCVSGKFLFDIPNSADVTGFILGADLVTKIVSGTGSAGLSGPSGAIATGDIAAKGGGAVITGNANTSVTGTMTRNAKSCGAFENVDVDSFIASGSAADGAHQVDLSLTATSLVTDSNGVLRSGNLNGQFFADTHLGKFAGTMDQTLPDKVPGHHLIIDFVDGTNDFADFVHQFFGKHPSS